MRRDSTQRDRQLKAKEREYEARVALAATSEERQLLANEFSAWRSAHRAEDVGLGRRPPGTAVMMRQVIWARWIEISSAHVASAEVAFRRVQQGQTEQLVEELRQSLVAITAAAASVEALYQEIRFLVDEELAGTTTATKIGACLKVALGLDDNISANLQVGLDELFGRRNEAIHPHTEFEVPLPHPAGVNTSAEASLFNFPETRKMLKTALQVMGYAENPPAPANEDVMDWVAQRTPYFQQVVAPIRAKLIDVPVAQTPV